MSIMLTIKEVAQATGMSQYAIRKGITSGVYPAIRACGNPKGKILVNINDFIATLNYIAHQNVAVSEDSTNTHPRNTIRKIAE